MPCMATVILKEIRPLLRNFLVKMRLSHCAGERFYPKPEECSCSEGIRHGRSEDVSSERTGNHCPGACLIGHQGLSLFEPKIFLAEVFVDHASNRLVIAKVSLTQGIAGSADDHLDFAPFLKFGRPVGVGEKLASHGNQICLPLF